MVPKSNSYSCPVDPFRDRLFMSSTWSSPSQEIRVAEKKRPAWTAPALAVMLLVAACIAHFPATHSGYIWDDNVSLYQNKLIRASDGLYRIWFTKQTLDYWPLTSTTFWIEWRIWGNHPKPYHVTNIILHALAAVVLWRVLIRLGLHGLGAFLGGLFFAVHPVTVESVAWIAERKNVLSMPLYLSAILVYLRFEDEGRWRWYAAALLAGAAALLAKTSVVALPVVLLLLGWYRHGRLDRRAFFRVAPFFLMSLVMGLVTIWFQQHHAIAGAQVRPEPYASRIASAGWVVWFYLYKLIWPANLLMVYPRWEIDGYRLGTHVPLALLVICVLILWHNRKGWGRGPLVAVGTFLLVLAPVLGVLEMSYARFSLVADHLQYAGIPGIMALAGGGLAAIWSGMRSSRGRRLVAGCIAMIALSLGVLTWRQARLYSDEITLWSHVIERNDRSWVAYNNRGGAYGGRHDYDLAIRDFDKVIALNPDNTEAWYNRGSAYGRKGDYARAVHDLSKAIELSPDYFEAYFNRANAHRGRGDFDQAIDDYTKVVQLQPTYWEAYYHRGLTYGYQGDLDRAIADYTQTLALNHEHAWAYYYRGMAYFKQGQLIPALENVSMAIALRGDAETYYERGNIHASLDQPQSALSDYSKAIELKPDYVEAYNNRGAIHSRLQDFSSAIRDQSKAIELAPTLAEAYSNRGNALMGRHDYAQAVVDYSKAINLNPHYIDAYFNRGLAYKELGRWPEALQDLSRILELKPDEAEAFGHRAVIHFLLRQYDRAWTDVRSCRHFGGFISDDFLRDLAALSGRSE